jgi:hypothetical protein
MIQIYKNYQQKENIAFFLSSILFSQQGQFQNSNTIAN